MPKVPTLLRAAQFLFWSAAIFTLVCAVLPYEHTIHIFKWDKAEHFLAFYVLTGLAVAAFPRSNLFIIAAAHERCTWYATARCSSVQHGA